MDAKAAKQIEDIRALLTAAGYEVMTAEPFDHGRWMGFLVNVKTRNEIASGSLSGPHLNGS